MMQRSIRISSLVLTLSLFLSSCSGDPDADKEKSVLKAAQAAYYQKDYTTAAQGFQILADRGNARAEFFLGEMYLNGTGVERDYVQALKWERMAAEQGNTESQYTLGGMYELAQGVPQDVVQAHVWYTLSASSGDERAIRKRAELEVKNMTMPQIEQSKQMVLKWIAAHNK